MRMDCIDMASWAPAGLDPMFFVNVLSLYLWSNVGLSPTALPVMLLYYYLNECFVIRVMSWITVLGNVIFNLHKITVSKKWKKELAFQAKTFSCIDHWKVCIPKGEVRLVHQIVVSPSLYHYQALNGKILLSIRKRHLGLHNDNSSNRKWETTKLV